MFKKLYVKYVELILNANPSKTWKAIRFILHWLTLPIKLFVIGTLGIYQIIRQELKTKTRPIPDHKVKEIQDQYFDLIMKKLPVLKREGHELYVNRVSYWDQPQPWNYNFDHQASRHGVYAFLMDKLGKRNNNIDTALRQHVQNGQLVRGYKNNPYTKELEYNRGTVSGDMLIGFSLAMFREEKEVIQEGTYLNAHTGLMKEAYDLMLDGIISNDYSFLEKERPEKQDVQQPMWDRLEKENEKIAPSKQAKMKSIRGMWQPGLETVGAQALTVLAAIRIGDKIIGASYAKKEYKKLLYRYGYGLLSLFPTAFIKSKRGYFNDHNCITALYILSQLSSSKLGKLFWKIPMVYVWLLSRKHYNGYFTGLLEDAHPGTVSQKYIQDCQAFLYEEEPKTYGYAQSSDSVPEQLPVKFNEMNQGEFYPDEDQKLLVPSDIDSETKRQVLSGIEKYRSGLGWLAYHVMLERVTSDAHKKRI